MTKCCVRCGKCLAVCPLYRLLRREEISPRGRILLTERSGAPDTIRCFACLRCAQVCPYELSPLDHPGQQMRPSERSVALLFDLIYYSRLPASGAPSDDPLMAAWYAVRTGGSHPVSVPCFDNGELFHPFLDERAARLVQVLSQSAEGAAS